MNYIINDNYKSKVYFSNNKNITINKPNHLLINDICNNFLIDYKSYRKNIKNKLNIANKAPIYLRDDLILVPIKSVLDYNNIWINYANIKMVKKVREDISKIKIIFINDDCLITDSTLIYYEQKIKQINNIKTYLSSLVIVNIFK